MLGDGLSDLLDEAFPHCPNDGSSMNDAGTAERPYFVCPSCGLVAV